MSMITALRPDELRRENAFGVDDSMPVLVLGAALVVLASVVLALVSTNSLMLIPGLAFFVLIVGSKLADLPHEQLAARELSVR